MYYMHNYIRAYAVLSNSMNLPGFNFLLLFDYKHVAYYFELLLFRRNDKNIVTNNQPKPVNCDIKS